MTIDPRQGAASLEQSFQKLTLTRTDHQLECLLCDKQFTGPEAQAQHLSSEKHKRKVLEKTEKEKTRDKVPSKGQQAEPLECLPCGKTFTGMQSKLDHLKSEKHLKKVQDENVIFVPKKEKNSPDEKPKSEELYCELCDKRFTGAQSQQEHLKSEKHLARVSGKGKGSSPPLHCAPCNKVFTGQESLLQHLNSRKHLNMVNA